MDERTPQTDTKWGRGARIGVAATKSPMKSPKTPRFLSAPTALKLAGHIRPGLYKCGVVFWMSSESPSARERDVLLGAHPHPRRAARTTPRAPWRITSCASAQHYGRHPARRRARGRRAPAADAVPTVPGDEAGAASGTSPRNPLIRTVGHASERHARRGTHVTVHEDAPEEMRRGRTRRRAGMCDRGVCASAAAVLPPMKSSKVSQIYFASTGLKLARDV